MSEHFTVLKTEGLARRGEFRCAHGTAQTPVFMNVGTQAAIKGGLSARDLEQIGCQIELSNTYHLHVRPGDQLVRQMGGLHRFMDWKKPILTDSGGFQVFSLAGLRKIKEEGVTFHSHVDGRKIFMGPEESMAIQSNLGSDIAMAFDECIENPAPYDYVERSCERTLRWLQRCKTALAELNARPDAVNPGQLLFGINQGGTYDDLRVRHMQQIAQLDLPGYAIGGLAVGESHEEMYHILDVVLPHAPADKPRYLMGVGTPSNIIEGVARGIDFFDCVLPARNARPESFLGTMPTTVMHMQDRISGIPKKPGFEKEEAKTAIPSFLKNNLEIRTEINRTTAAARELISSPVIRSEVRSTRNPLMMTQGSAMKISIFPSVLLPSAEILPERKRRKPTPTSRNIIMICQSRVIAIDMVVPLI